MVRFGRLRCQITLTDVNSERAFVHCACLGVQPNVNRGTQRESTGAWPHSQAIITDIGHASIVGHVPVVEGSVQTPSTKKSDVCCVA